MNTILAAVKDLWNFVWGLEQKKHKSENNLSTLLIAPPAELIKLPEMKKEVTPNLEINKPKGDLSINNKDFASLKYYITASPGLVFNRPVLSYDGVLAKLPYATMTTVLAYEGRFARIPIFDSTGWILKDDLTSEANEVFPELVSLAVYTADHPETQKLRKYIEDEFFTRELFLPLQSTELVAYQLKKHGYNIDWPAVRPRHAGTWQNILKGKNGIKIGLVPKTGSIIEYNKDDGTGFVGYTKSVRVDESIIIEGVGRQAVGEYREELIEKNEWQNWRPVWISVS